MRISIENRKLRYRIPWMMLVGLAAGLISSAFWAVVSVYFAWQLFAEHKLPLSSVIRRELRVPMVPKVTLLAVFFAVAFCGFVFLVIRRILETRRGWVRIDGEGISTVDLRNTETRVNWTDILGVRITVCGGVCRWIPPVWIVTARGSMAISPLVQSRDELIEEIITRAHLVKSRETWYQIVYRRSSSDTPV